MKVFITGGAGFLGQKLAKKLAGVGKIGDVNVTELILADIITASTPEGASFSTNAVTADFSKPDEVKAALACKPDVIFHLAAIVSGEAEKNFDLGYSINVDGFKCMLDAIRDEEEYTPRLVLSSSAAVFGSPVPDSSD